MGLKPVTLTANTFDGLKFQANEAIKELTDYIEQIFGVDGKTFVSQNAIDMNEQEIQNAAPSTTPTSVAVVSQVTTVSGNLSTLQTQVNTQGSDIDDLETDVTTLQSDLTALQAQVNAMKLPIGTVIELTVATNPGTLLGYGTWAAWGTGRVTIAIDAGDVDFDTVEETGGAKTVDLSHVHSINHTHPGGTDVQVGAGEVVNDGAYVGDSGTAGSLTQNVMNPYVIVHRWRRTS